MSKAFKHEWGFMANPGSNGLGELAYCELCKHWRYDSGKPFKMSREEYERLHASGEIDATEALGEIKK